MYQINREQMELNNECWVIQRQEHLVKFWNMLFGSGIKHFFEQTNESTTSSPFRSPISSEALANLSQNLLRKAIYYEDTSSESKLLHQFGYLYGFRICSILIHLDVIYELAFNGKITKRSVTRTRLSRSQGCDKSEFKASLIRSTPMLKLNSTPCFFRTFHYCTRY